MTDDATQREAALQGALIKLATEGWRFLRVVQRVQQDLDAEQQRRLGTRVAFYDRILSDELGLVGLKLVDFAGQAFGPQIAASAINADDFTDADVLVVDQTVEPAVLDRSGVLRSGTVILKRSAS